MVELECSVGTELLKATVSHLTPPPPIGAKYSCQSQIWLCSSESEESSTEERAQCVRLPSCPAALSLRQYLQCPGQLSEESHFWKMSLYFFPLGI